MNSENTADSTGVVPVVADAASSAESASTSNNNATKSGGSTGSGGSFDLSKAVSDGPYVLNKNNGMVHYSGCSRLPYPENRAYFETLEDALNAGNTSKCSYCF